MDVMRDRTLVASGQTRHAGMESPGNLIFPTIPIHWLFS